MMTCERCGATDKEAQLTVSHAPQQALAKICGHCSGGLKNKFQKYCLCTRCHLVYSQLEKRILQEACEAMLKKHEEYVNQ